MQDGYPSSCGDRLVLNVRQVPPLHTRSDDMDYLSTTDFSAFLPVAKGPPPIRRSLCTTFDE
ncbi:hypothetical protein CAEBREN_30349 [Caenorhabditis brenneri]|uniref:Uncharacterized protein n=1 Tax=Caenorhabditis brenneri TaxID=135651 RepID=G0MI07_CAEBE|nr:hypothetical protein CAEBREN_30349 [Caenorhabditis brenneri]